MVLALWALLWFPIALFYRVRSLASGEKLDRRKEGLPILLTLRPLGGLCLLGIITFVVKPSWMAWSSLPLPLWLRWSGLGIGVIAATLSLSTLHNLGKNLTDTVVTRQAHQLVTTGPYRWVRHPFYDAVLLCVLTASLLTANWFIFLTGCSVFALQVVRTGREEQQLLARFGQRYLAYTHQTGRFLPRMKPSRGDDQAAT
jgi:protein-S-isoprenylcysteine O-methyltransferase Ste14